MPRRRSAYEGPMKRYDYAHRQGVRAISWEEFATLTAQLAEALEQMGVEAIVGIA